MPSTVPVPIPIENVNDEFVTVVRWLVADGDPVREGQCIAEIETSKALIELIAPAPGRIAILVPDGTEVRANATIALLHAEEYSTTDAAATHGRRIPEAAEEELQPARPDSGSAGLEEIRFSKRAIELMEQSGLSQDLFRGQSLVRESDVRARLEALERDVQDLTKHPPRLGSIQLSGVTLPELAHSTERGKLDPEFVSALRNNREEFARLSSDEKCRSYRDHGAVIGCNVEIGAGTVILANGLILEDEVRVGAYGSINCTGPFFMGAMSSIRDGADVEASTIVLGQNVFACRRIEISGGRNNPYSALYAGDSVFIGDDVVLDVSRPIVIGKEVFLTQRAIVITHNIGHSILDGFENRFEAVVLEDRCQVGMNCTIYAGARVGQDAIVASNSYVVTSIARGKLAMGVPAREIRDAARRLDREKQIRIARQMVRDLQDWLALRGYEVHAQNEDSFMLMYENKRFRLVFTEHFTSADQMQMDADEGMIWALETQDNAPPGCTVVNLLEKTIQGTGGLAAESAREFLRKRGIRCQPQPWRYRQGLL
jgi:acetyltransferase-like isoleucine patch superfamily enzyme